VLANLATRLKAPVQAEPAQFLRREEPDRIIVAKVKDTAPKSWDRRPRYLVASDTERYDGWSYSLEEAAILTFPQAVKFWIQARAANSDAKNKALRHYEFVIEKV
jgi:hypothetical protein